MKALCWHGRNDNQPDRLSMAAVGGAIKINYDEESVLDRLNDLTQGKGPEKCIDAVGMEAARFRDACRNNNRTAN